MDRTTFLQHVGIGLLALTGFASIMGALNGYGKQRAVSSGFGSGSYGGGRESSKTS
ncbi:MAG TPA: hypothetical protein PL051_04990 [Candidatus Saccharibacteria bacterium]|nr:hypothetical protein [Candidatus Saccharibacteria bacterium]HRJ91391.1 hypothetical protein [Candidatus Saccharibacteria bacterium]